MSIDSTITKITDAILKLAAAVDRLADAQSQPVSMSKVEAVPCTAEPATAPAQAEEPAPAPAPAPGPTETAPVTSEPAEVTFDDARKAIIDAVSNKGRDTVASILKDMGASNIKELSADQYPELIKRCEGV